MSQINPTSIERLASNNTLSLFLIMKFFGTKGKQELHNMNIVFFNYNFVMDFNSKNNSNFSINEFQEVMNKLTQKQIYKRVFKFNCNNCSKVSAVEEKEDTFNNIFYTGHTCRHCNYSSSINNNPELTKELTFYTLTETKVDQDWFTEKELPVEVHKETKWELIKKSILQKKWLWIILILIFYFLLNLI